MIALGANALSQAINFLISLSIGLVGGIVGIAYFLRSRPLEKILVDFLTTIAIGIIFIVMTEYLMGGKIEPYLLLAYLLGIAIVLVLYKKIKQYFTKIKLLSSKNDDINPVNS